jgi:hypothetical protein
MRRRTAPAIALALMLSIPVAAQAQLGGLVKKAKGKLAPAAAPATTATSSDEPARLPGPALTAEVVDRFLAGLKTEKTERDREAARRDRESAAHARQMKAANNHDQCARDWMAKDPAAAERDSLIKAGNAAAQQKDYNRAQQIGFRLQQVMTDIQGRADSACAAPQALPADQQAMQQASIDPAAAGARAAGMTGLEYGQVRELIITYLGYPARAGLTPAEKQAVDARRGDLTAALRALGE